MSMSERDFEIVEGWLREAMEYGEERHNEPYEKAIHALEEIQQYRAVGTVEDIKKVISFLSSDSDNSIIDDLNLLNEYRFIGTVSEFRELKEKATAKPIKGRKFIEAICPHCESEIFDTYWAFGGIHYCPTCGSAIDWSEGKE